MRFSELWYRSCQTLKGNWGMAILASLIHTAITGSAGELKCYGTLLGVLLSPLTAGLQLFFLRLAEKGGKDLKNLFQPFNDYARFLWGAVRVMIFTLLWTLLFIVPGIIAGLRYSQAIFLMLDDPELKAAEAMKQSALLMKGHKWQLFCYLFVLILLLVVTAVCTLGIGLIWYVPFMHAFAANFYLALRDRAVLPETN